MNTYTLADIAAMRERRICTTSHYKMMCGCCGNTINRGDEITQVLGSKGRMRARFASFRCHAADAESGCHTPYAYAPTRNEWVHLHCRPQYFRDWGNGSEGYFPIPTAYSYSIDMRKQAAAFDPDWGEDYFSIPRPVWKWESERLEKEIVPIQRCWRNWKKRVAEKARQEWKKKCREAAVILDSAATEIVQMWQLDMLKYLWRVVRNGRGACHFIPRDVRDWSWNKDNSIGKEEKKFRREWGRKVMQAAQWLDYANSGQEWDWQYVYLSVVLHYNIFTKKRRLY